MPRRRDRRERQRGTALAKAVDGDGPGALALIYEHVQEFPRDVFVLKPADGPFGLLDLCTLNGLPNPFHFERHETHLERGRCLVATCPALNGNPIAP